MLVSTPSSSSVICEVSAGPSWAYWGMSIWLTCRRKYSYEKCISQLILKYNLKGFMENTFGALSPTQERAPLGFESLCGFVFFEQGWPKDSSTAVVSMAVESCFLFLRPSFVLRGSEAAGFSTAPGDTSTYRKSQI